MLKQAEIKILSENMLDHKRKIIIFNSTTFFTAEIRKHKAVDARYYKRAKRSTGLTL